MREYFPALYQLHGRERFVIWISDDKVDTFILDSDNSVPSFSSNDELVAYLKRLNLVLSDQSSRLHNLDWCADFSTNPNQAVDPVEILCAWNLFGDMAATLPNRSLAFKTLNQHMNGLYEKVFWANNLPSVTPQGKEFNPEWTRDDRRKLASILKAGLQLFESSIREINPIEST